MEEETAGERGIVRQARGARSFSFLARIFFAAGLLATGLGKAVSYEHG